MILVWILLNIIYFCILIFYTRQINLIYFLFTMMNILVYSLNRPLLNWIWALFLLMVLLNCLMIHFKGKQFPEGNSEVMIILGYVLYHNQMQPLLYKRLDTAYEYYLKHPELLIVVTGGITKGNNVSESLAMKEYLISKGVPENRISEEDQAQTTYDNLLNCEKYVRSKDQYIILVTNQFHMKRAIMIAYKAGYTKVQGLSASNSIEFLSSYLREFFVLISMKIHHQL